MLCFSSPSFQPIAVFLVPCLCLPSVHLSKGPLPSQVPQSKHSSSCLDSCKTPATLPISAPDLHLPFLHTLARGIFPQCQSDGSCQTRHVWLALQQSPIVGDTGLKPLSRSSGPRCPLDSSHASSLPLSLPQPCWCLSSKRRPLPPCAVGIQSLCLLCSTSFSESHTCDQAKSFLQWLLG